MASAPVLVGHRGYPERYPENTLIGIEAALEAGAQAIEFDVQLSADGIPILFHDHELTRITGVEGLVTERSLYELRTLRAFEPQRFGKLFYDVKIATLREAVDLLSAWPMVEIFVEIKSESLDFFGREKVLKAVLDTIIPIAKQCVLISFNFEVLNLYRQKFTHLYQHRIAWVLHKYDEAHKAKAVLLKPEMLVCNMKKIEQEESLWPGAWEWMVYETDDPLLVFENFKKGARYIETDHIGELLPKIKADQK